jgi:dienelactone hydrolase
VPEFHEIACEHEGVPLSGYYARPANGAARAPAVIAFPGAAGGATRMKMTVTKLAELGYLAAAVSMYDVRVDGTDENVAGEQFMQLLSAPEKLRDRARLWFDTFAVLDGVDPGRIATLGYCFGGKCVLEIARSGADVKATVSYHGLLTTHAPAAPGAIRGPVAAYCAGRDPYVPPADIEGFRKELSDAGVSFQVTEFSDAYHAFTDPDAASHAREGIAFDPLAEAVSWAGTVALLERELAPR